MSNNYAGELLLSCYIYILNNEHWHGFQFPAVPEICKRQVKLLELSTAMKQVDSRYSELFHA